MNDRYTSVWLDNGPDWTPQTQSALAAADYAIIPCQVSLIDVRAMDFHRNRIGDINTNHANYGVPSNIQIAGAIASIVDKASAYDMETLPELYAALDEQGVPHFKTTLMKDDTVKRAAEAQKPTWVYAPNPRPPANTSRRGSNTAPKSPNTNRRERGSSGCPDVTTQWHKRPMLDFSEEGDKALTVVPEQPQGNPLDAGMMPITLPGATLLIPVSGGKVIGQPMSISWAIPLAQLVVEPAYTTRTLWGTHRDHQEDSEYLRLRQSISATEGNITALVVEPNGKTVAIDGEEKPQYRVREGVRRYWALVDLQIPESPGRDHPRRNQTTGYVSVEPHSK